MAVIKVQNVHKKFKVYYDKGYSLKEKMLFLNRNSYESRWVLKGIDFEAEKGQAIGLIGENGCGKSTLLKLMTRIMYPDQGNIILQGRVSSLIELGAGFHPDMSGRENIFTNAAIFGLSRKEIEKRLDSIIAFSELGRFIDSPVRTYSSGMYMRLAFSVAINVDADILLIDEILAVGDANFQAKCFNRLKAIKAEGLTIVIVSHAMSQIEQICDNVIWIDEGRIRSNGPPRQTIQEYMGWIMSKSAQDSPVEEPVKPEEATGPVAVEERQESAGQEAAEEPDAAGENPLTLREIGSRQVKITGYKLVDPQTGKEKGNYPVGANAKLIVKYERQDQNLKEAIFGVVFVRNDEVICYSTNNLIDTGEVIALKDKGTIELSVTLSLMQGEYYYGFGLHMDYGPTYHGILNAGSFTIYNTLTDYGVAHLDHEWRIS